MTNFSTDIKMVRVDFFQVRADGWKWYTTEAIEFVEWKGDPQNGGMLIEDAFVESLRRSLRAVDAQQLRGRLRYASMLAVCLDPYHEHAHPLAVLVPEQ